MTLIDTGPQHSKEILKHAALYEDAVTRRISALAEEVREKTIVRELIHKDNLSRLEDGSIKVTIGRVVITVTPTDEKVNIKHLTPES